MIKANKLNIHPTATIADDVEIHCDVFELGAFSYIGSGCKIECKEFRAGDYLWMPANAEIGRGGCNGPDSVVVIGRSVGIFEGVVINPSERVEIGDCVGIGADCLIWTHGAWCDPLLGFPFSFAPISIGSNVWLPARSIVLPGANIGNNVVIGTGSIITKSIPDGALAMGTPCKVIQENAYPKKLTKKEIENMLTSIVEKWYNELLPHKDCSDVKSYLVDEYTITLEYLSGEVTVFDTLTYTVNGIENDISEDFRDYLRRHGIRIYNGKPFKSMKPSYEKTHYLTAS